jgi:hypothetical protein
MSFNPAVGISLYLSRHRHLSCGAFSARAGGCHARFRLSSESDDQPAAPSLLMQRLENRHEIDRALVHEGGRTAAAGTNGGARARGPQSTSGPRRAGQDGPAAAVDAGKARQGTATSPLTGLKAEP